MNSYSPLIGTLAASIPVLLAYLIAIVVALAYIGQYPRPATLTLIAAITLLVTTVVQQVIQINLVSMWRTRGWTASQYSAAIGGISLVFNILRAGAFGLLTWAVFSGRSTNAPSEGFPIHRAPPPLP